MAGLRCEEFTRTASRAAAVAPPRTQSRDHERGGEVSWASVFPQVVRRVLQDDVDAARAIAVLEQVLHHRVVLLALLLVAGAGLGDDAADVSHRRHELLLDRFLQRLVALVADPVAAAARGPEVR